MYKVAPARDIASLEQYNDKKVLYTNMQEVVWTSVLGSRSLELILKYVVLFQQLSVRAHGVLLLLLNCNKTAVAIPLEGLDYCSL